MKNESGDNSVAKGWQLIVEGLLDEMVETGDRVRVKGLNFHVESQDYFGTLATVIDLVLQDQLNPKRQRQVLKNLREDLVFLHSNYQIVRRNK